MQKIGVFVCHCGTNIASTVDVHQVAEVLKNEPGVVFSTDYQYMCSQSGQDIIKQAMLAVYRRLSAEHMEGKLILQVHDELIVECPQSEGEQVARILEEEMERVVSLSVPLLAEAHVGRSWADAH